MDRKDNWWNRTETKLDVVHADLVRIEKNLIQLTNLRIMESGMNLIDKIHPGFLANMTRKPQTKKKRTGK